MPRTCLQRISPPPESSVDSIRFHNYSSCQIFSISESGAIWFRRNAKPFPSWVDSFYDFTPPNGSRFPDPFGLKRIPEEPKKPIRVHPPARHLVQFSKCSLNWNSPNSFENYSHRFFVKSSRAVWIGINETPAASFRKIEFPSSNSSPRCITSSQLWNHNSSKFEKEYRAVQFQTQLPSATKNVHRRPPEPFFFLLLFSPPPSTLLYFFLLFFHKIIIAFVGGLLLLEGAGGLNSTLGGKCQMLTTSESSRRNRTSEHKRDAPAT